MQRGVRFMLRLLRIWAAGAALGGIVRQGAGAGFGLGGVLALLFDIATWSGLRLESMSGMVEATAIAAAATAATFLTGRRGSKANVLMRGAWAALLGFAFSGCWKIAGCFVHMSREE